MNLSDRDQAMLDGEHGPAPQLAMSILVRMADVYGAAELMDISQAHIDSTIYLGDATLEFAERLASLGARVAVPTSLNVSGVDECGWKEWAVTPEWAAKAARQMLAYERMGAVPTWTCAPYQTHMRPVVRPADRLGRVERDRVRQLGHRRAHRALSGSARHLLRDHRPGAGGRPAPHGEPRRPDAACASSACRARCSRTISSSPCSAIWSARSRDESIPVIDGIVVRRPKIS